MKVKIKKTYKNLSWTKFYPKSSNPFRAIRVADAFPLAKWAKMPIFRNYFALAPNRIPDNAPIRKRRDYIACLHAARKFVDQVRRDDIRFVISCALEEAKERGLKSVVAKLKRLNAETIRLPTAIIYRYTKVITKRTFWRTHLKPDKVERRYVPSFFRLGINYILEYGYTDPMLTLKGQDGVDALETNGTNNYE